MNEGCPKELSLTFAVLLDLASTSRVREWFALCMRYVGKSSPGARPDVVERLLCMIRTANKDGQTIMRLVAEAIDGFNRDMLRLHKFMPSLFGGEPPRELRLENCTGYGSDGGGGTRSAYVSANCRIKQYNPICLDIWCGAHQGHLMAKHGSKGNRYLERYYEISVRLQRTLSMSAEADGMFANAQIASGEVKALHGQRYISFCDQIMFKWASEKNHLDAIAKVILATHITVVNLSRETTTTAGLRYRAEQLALFVCTPEHILYIALKRDILILIVVFITELEVPGADFDVFEQSFTECRDALEVMRDRDGPCLTEAKKRLRGELVDEAKGLPSLEPLTKDYQVEDWITDMDNIHRAEAVDCFIKQMDYYYSKETLELLKAFAYFSINKFRKDVTTKDDAVRYGEDMEKILIKYFCHPMKFVGTWPEARGQEFVSDPIGEEADLARQLLAYKLHLFRYFVGVDPSTGLEYTSKKVCLKLLEAPPPFLNPLQGPLQQILRCYLNTPVSTASVESVFSAVKMIDNSQCRSRDSDATSQYLVINRESASWKKFTTDMAVTFWEQIRPKEGQEGFARRISLGHPKVVFKPDSPKPKFCLLKTADEKAEARRERGKRREMEELGRTAPVPSNLWAPVGRGGRDFDDELLSDPDASDYEFEGYILNPQQDPDVLSSSTHAGDADAGEVDEEGDDINVDPGGEDNNAAVGDFYDNIPDGSIDLPAFEIEPAFPVFRL